MMSVIRSRTAARSRNAGGVEPVAAKWRQGAACVPLLMLVLYGKNTLRAGRSDRGMGLLYDVLPLHAKEPEGISRDLMSFLIRTAERSHDGRRLRLSSGMQLRPVK
jgi:hypothetical protein